MEGEQKNKNKIRERASLLEKKVMGNEYIILFYLFCLTITRCDINDFTKFIEKFSTVIWDIVPYLSKLQSRNISLPNAVIENFFNFNDPKSHKHKVKNIDF